MEDLTDVCERPFPKRKPGGTEAGQPVLTNTHNKKTKYFVGTGRNLKAVKFSVLGQIPGVDTSVIIQG